MNLIMARKRCKISVPPSYWHKKEQLLDRWICFCYCFQVGLIRDQLWWHCLCHKTSVPVVWASSAETAQKFPNLKVISESMDKSYISSGIFFIKTLHQLIILASLAQGMCWTANLTSDTSSIHCLTPKLLALLPTESRHSSLDLEWWKIMEWYQADQGEEEVKFRFSFENEIKFYNLTHLEETMICFCH